MNWLRSHLRGDRGLAGGTRGRRGGRCTPSYSHGLDDGAEQRIPDGPSVMPRMAFRSASAIRLVVLDGDGDGHTALLIDSRELKHVCSSLSLSILSLREHFPLYDQVISRLHARA